MRLRSTPSQVAPSSNRNDEERSVLDYRLALRTAQREIDSVVRQIDQADDEIDVIRKDLHAREVQKEMLTERHLTLGATIMALDALANGKSLIREFTAQENEGA